MSVHPQGGTTRIREVASLILVVPPSLHFRRPKVEGRGTRHTSPFSETHDPIMVLTSAARRGRGHGVRADVNTGTRNVVRMVTPGRMRSRGTRTEIFKNDFIFIFSDLTRRSRILANFGLEILLDWQKRMTTNLFSDSTQALSSRKDSSQKGSPASAAGLDQ